MTSPIRAWIRRRLSKKPVPSEWLGYLEGRVPFFSPLPEDEKAAFLEKLKLFVWEKRFIGAGGLEITDEIQVVIAAVAVRLILHLDFSYYDRLSEIVVYPYDFFRHPDSETDLLGEAHDWGVVVLSWPAVLEGLADPSDGHDPGTHEFAHALDRASGEFDGTPVLRSHAHYGVWTRVMSEHFLNLREGRSTEAGTLDEYGATNEAEFFAVVTEMYFERPEELKSRLPDLFAEIARFYRGEG